jgi:hypothetical protein
LSFVLQLIKPRSTTTNNYSCRSISKSKSIITPLGWYLMWTQLETVTTLVLAPRHLRLRKINSLPAFNTRTLEFHEIYKHECI